MVVNDKVGSSGGSNETVEKSPSFKKSTNKATSF